MIAYCGLVCSSCPTFLATQNDDDAAREKTAAFYSKKFGFNLKPEDIKVILATDCGSTTTKAILIQKQDGVYRQTHRGEAPTTVEEPIAVRAPR